MRILQFSPEYPPHSLGGGGFLVKNLSQGLSQHGLQVNVVAGYYPVAGMLDHPFSENIQGIIVEWLPLLPTPKVGFQLKTIMPPNLRSLKRLLKIFFGGNFDVVHIHGFGHFICDWASILCRLTGRKYILTIHGFPKEPERRGGILKLIYDAYSITLGSHSIRNAAKTVVVSKSLVRECLSYIPQEKIEVIQNAVNLESYYQFSSEQVLKVAARYNLTGKQVILCIGRLSVAKGFHYAIRVLPLVLKEIPNSHLVIIGKENGSGYLEGLRRLAVEEGVESHVSFVGGLVDEEKTALLLMSRVVAIPSIEEPFGIVALEAMASGKPIVASRVGGLTEVLSADMYSLLVEKENKEQFARALIKVMNDEDLCANADKYKKLRIGRFDLDQMVGRYIGLYQKSLTQV